MTSRTSPGGVVVLAMAGMFAVGCTAQTGAVFQALLDPASAPASPSGDGGERTGPDDVGPTWWPHPDGYAVRLPGGWSGISLDAARTDQLLDAVARDHPGLATRASGVLGATGSDVSMVAADTSANQALPPILLVVSQPTDGRKARFVKARTYEQISMLPGLRGGIIRDDERLRYADAVRYDYLIADDDLGMVRVRSYLFRSLGRAYLVSFLAGEAGFEDAEATFDDIVESIRFGV